MGLVHGGQQQQVGVTTGLDDAHVEDERRGARFAVQASHPQVGVAAGLGIETGRTQDALHQLDRQALRSDQDVGRVLADVVRGPQVGGIGHDLAGTGLADVGEPVVDQCGPDGVVDQAVENDVGLADHAEVLDLDAGRAVRMRDIEPERVVVGFDLDLGLPGLVERVYVVDDQILGRQVGQFDRFPRVTNDHRALGTVDLALEATRHRPTGRVGRRIDREPRAADVAVVGDVIDDDLGRRAGGRDAVVDGDVAGRIDQQLRRRRRQQHGVGVPGDVAAPVAVGDAVRALMLDHDAEVG